MEIARTLAVIALAAPITSAAWSSACRAQAPTSPATPPASQPAEPGTPQRDDGRVAATINPNPRAYAWTTQEERIARLEKANALRNELLAKYPLPIAVAKRVPDGSITVDGKLDEPAWKQAEVITGLRDYKTGEVVAHQTKFRLLWDSKYLYIGAECDDDDLTAKETKRNGAVWDDDCVEAFINPSGDEMSYLEFELNPLGTWYEGTVADYRPEVDWKLSGGNLNMTQAMTTFISKQSKWVVNVDGNVNAHDGKDKGWTAEIALAWTDIARGTNVIRPVPQDGDVWRMNLYRVDVSAPNAKKTVYSAWNPTGTWFHRPWMFGRVVFID
jgi:hypothetical protein